MKTRVEETGPCRRTLWVEADWNDVATEYEQLLGKYTSQAKLPGFRKGKAPADVVERRFRKPLEQDAKEQLVPKFYQEGLKETQLEPVAVVGADQVELSRENGLSFRVVVDVAPKFKLPKYRKIGLKSESTEVSDEDLDKAIEGLRLRFSRYEDVEGRPVKPDDLVLIDYTGRTTDGQSLSDLASDCSGLGEGADFWALAGEPEFIPGLTKELHGLSVGDEKDITITFAEDFHVPAVAGKEAVYHVKVKGIRERIMPALDEAFAKNFQAESVEALRARVAEDMKKAAEERERERLKSEITEFLVEKTKIDPPESLVEHQARQTFYSMARSMIRQGATKEQVEERHEQLSAQAAGVAANRVKLEFILKAIAGEENIAVSEDDMNEHIQNMSTQYQMPPERLRAELEQRERMDGVRDELLCNKTLDFLLEEAKIK